MELVAPTPERPAVVIGEAMVELSGVETGGCRLGVAGDTFNAAVAMARAGTPTAYLTAVGDDPFSDRILKALAAEGIGTAHVLRRAGGKPGLYAVSLDEVGERAFTYWRMEAAVRSLLATDGAGEALAAAEDAPLLLLSGITLSVLGPPGQKRMAELAEAVRARGGTVAFDTNYRPAGWASAHDAAEAVAAFGRHVTLALPTFEDDAALFGDAAPEACVERWAGWGAEEVVVKHGADGAFVHGNGWVRPPAVVEPLDTTGAGDAFTGAYLAARVRGEGPEAAAMAGHRYAALVLRTHGAIPDSAIPERTDG